MLTPAQLAAWKTDIAANTATISQPGGPLDGVQIKNISYAGNSDNADAIAKWYSALASPAYFAWDTAAQKSAIDAAINKAAFTPSDAVPNSPSTDMTYQNRALLCQLKQSNALWLVGGQNPTLDASGSSERQNFKDCLLQIPSGASGANSDAGWGSATVPGAARLALMRACNRIEKVLAVAGAGPGNVGTDARGANTNPDVLTFVGSVIYSDLG